MGNTVDLTLINIMMTKWQDEIHVTSMFVGPALVDVYVGDAAAVALQMIGSPW